MSPIAAFAPAWIGFEVLQLIVSERYLGVKQIQAGRDPRLAGPTEVIAFVWSALIACYWIWMFGMLYVRVGLPQILALLTISAIGYTVRRSCGLKWVLVVLTFEGAIRIGMLVSLCTLLWHEIY